MQSLRSWFRAAWIVLLVAAFVVLLDQITKGWVRATIPVHTYIVPFPVLGKSVLLEHVVNTGAAFGIFQNQNRSLVAVALVVSGAILFFAPRFAPGQIWIRIFLGMQLGGALANVFDRLNHGYVTDFMRIGIPGAYYWPSFNVADSAIVIGVIGLGFIIIRDDIRRERQAKSVDPFGSEGKSGATASEADSSL